MLKKRMKTAKRRRNFFTSQTQFFPNTRMGENQSIFNYRYCYSVITNKVYKVRSKGKTNRSIPCGKKRTMNNTCVTTPKIIYKNYAWSMTTNTASI